MTNDNTLVLNPSIDYFSLSLSLSLNKILFCSTSRELETGCRNGRCIKITETMMP